MTNDVRFFRCKHCGNFVGAIHFSGVPMICCGEKMEEVIPNTTDAAQEKHVPEVTVSGSEVKALVGSIAHPMTEEHSIQWVYLQTNKGGQRKCLAPNEEPSVIFCLAEDETPVAVYAYCNLHGLWKKEI